MMDKTPTNQLLALIIRLLFGMAAVAIPAGLLADVHAASHGGQDGSEQGNQ